jgi:hypothetical protein
MIDYTIFVHAGEGGRRNAGTARGRFEPGNIGESGSAAKAGVNLGCARRLRTWTNGRGKFRRSYSRGQSFLEQISPKSSVSSGSSYRSCAGSSLCAFAQKADPCLAAE